MEEGAWEGPERRWPATNQGEWPLGGTDPAAPLCLNFWLQDCETINLCGVSSPVCHSSPSKLTQRGFSFLVERDVVVCLNTDAI